VTPIRQQLADVDWERTAALTVVIGFLLFPLRWIWRRVLVRLLADALREVLKDDLAPLKEVGTCAEALARVVGRLESVEEDMVLVLDVALGIDRRSWEERRAQLRANAVDRRKSRHPLTREDPIG
jgi:hypothetical protein